MKLNFNDQFLNLVGEPLPQKMDDTLACILADSSTSQPQKMISWAHDLIENGEIEITKDEAKFLKKLIENNFSLSNLAKDQLLTRIDRAIESSICA